MKHLIFCLFPLLLVLCGCKKPLKEPENLDSVYVGILEELSTARSLLSTEKKALETSKKEWREVEPQTGQEVIKRNAFFKAQKNVRKYEQLVKYYELRLESRKGWARKSYLEAWNKGEKWPSDDLAQKYKAHQRLQEASRNWNTRVPKLHDRIERYTSSLKQGDEPQKGSH